MIRLMSIMLLVLATPRTLRAQPADAGVPDVPPPPSDAPPPEAVSNEPPRIVHKEAPIFPDVPKERQKPTDVTVHIELDASGTLTDARVISGPNEPFDSLAIAAVGSWTFEAPKQAGKPLPSHSDVIVHFDPNVQGGSETIHVVDELAPTDAVRAPDVGAQDFRRKTDKIATAIPQPKGATGLLYATAPGFLLTNEGGEGHADQIFLRGFDAREGQDIEIRVAGDVVNQSGNLHGNGLADLHFVIPELVQSIRVLEGPYDPRQGNYAVAGSAEYELGLVRRGLFASYDVGSFGTKRALLLWGPTGDGPHTFGGVELFETDGFGQNRDARRATALGQVEAKLGEYGVWRLTTGAYITDYHAAGVLRDDDYQLHQRNPAMGKGFYDTYDFGQGGSNTRAFLIGAVEHHHEDVTYHHQVSLTGQTMRLLEDFTGLLLDQQEPFQAPHGQRGDLIDVQSDAFTAQAGGFMRQRHEVLGHPQELELGYFGRIDRVSGTEYRIERANGHPYHKDTDLDATLGDIGLYAGANLKLTDWLMFRGGVRSDLLTYNVIDNCAVHDISHPEPTNPPGDASCLSQADHGVYREPVQRATASGSVVLPRASLLVGPFEHVTTSLGYGQGVRSIDPIYISQDIKTPFASVTSYDAGAAYAARLGEVDTTINLSGFRTHVDKDLVFSETVGRNVLSNGTTRTGVSLSGQLTGSWFEQIASATLVQSTFDDTKLLIPYVPDLVVRSDTIVSGELPWWNLGPYPVTGLIGLGVSYVGRRALPFGERSDQILTIDGSAQATWDRYTVGIKATNLLDTQYRLGEYNYSSDFNSQPEPTLAIARHFSAGAPRSVLFHVEVKL